VASDKLRASHRSPFAFASHLQLATEEYRKCRITSM
jgi:hypothetical protein